MPQGHGQRQLADVIELDSRRSAPARAGRSRQFNEPLAPAKWAVIGTFVLILAALASGQA